MGNRSQEKANVNLWDELFRLRDEYRERTKGAPRVIKGNQLPLERNKQGLIRWYMHPSLKDTAIRSLIFFVQEIPFGSRSGRLKFQGGQAIYVWQGKGHTILDGVRYDWEAGDAINLPLRRDGIIVQHFNDGDTVVKLVCVEPNLVDMMGVDRGSGFEQLEISPDYQK